MSPTTAHDTTASSIRGNDLQNGALGSDLDITALGLNSGTSMVRIFQYVHRSRINIWI